MVEWERLVGLRQTAVKRRAAALGERYLVEIPYGDLGCGPCVPHRRKAGAIGSIEVGAKLR